MEQHEKPDNEVNGIMAYNHQNESYHGDPHKECPTSIVVTEDNGDAMDSGEDNDYDPDTVVQASMTFPLLSEASTVQTSAEPVKDPSPLSDSQDVSLASVGGDSGSESDMEDNNEDLDLEDSWQGRLCNKVRVDNPELPGTVTRLTTPEGGILYLVGTAHFSIESQEDVAKTIHATQPDVVLVELCKSRVNLLHMDEQTILEEVKNMTIDKIRSTIRQNGLVQGVMYLLLLSMSAHLTKELGMAPGGEFRRAFIEAKKVPSCLIHLGDRPLQITLERALSSLSVWQKMKLAFHIITSKGPVTKEEVERCKQRDLLEEMLAEMTGEFPALSHVFVTERDIYLTNSLHIACKPLVTPRSSTGTTPAVVVGVVGIGHVPGIVEHWGKVNEKDIPPLMVIPPPSMASRIIRLSVKMSFYTLAAYGLCRLLPVPNFLVPALSDVKTKLTGTWQTVWLSVSK